MKTNRAVLPANLRSLSILTDAAVCTSNAEVIDFVKASDLDAANFDRYCVYDMTYGVYRIFVEASPFYIEGP